MKVPIEQPSVVVPAKLVKPVQDAFDPGMDDMVEVEQPKKRRGRPKKEAPKKIIEDQSDFEANVEDSRNQDDARIYDSDDSEDEVIVKPAKRGRKPKATQKPDSPRDVGETESAKESLPDPEGEATAKNDSIIVEPPTKAPSKRGRKRKETPSYNEEFVHEDHDANEPSTGLGLANATPSAISKPLKENAALANATLSPPPPEPQTTKETPTQTPTKREVDKEKGPDKHSPLQSGKVPYRVGLSRRMRIEPLLKIVKK
jgi:hypothetical protein